MEAGWILGALALFALPLLLLLGAPRKKKTRASQGQELTEIRQAFSRLRTPQELRAAPGVEGASSSELDALRDHEKSWEEARRCEKNLARLARKKEDTTAALLALQEAIEEAQTHQARVEEARSARDTRRRSSAALLEVREALRSLEQAVDQREILLLDEDERRLLAALRRQAGDEGMAGETRSNIAALLVAAKARAAHVEGRQRELLRIETELRDAERTASRDEPRWQHLRARYPKEDLGVSPVALAQEARALFKVERARQACASAGDVDASREKFAAIEQGIRRSRHALAEAEHQISLREEKARWARHRIEQARQKLRLLPPGEPRLREAERMLEQGRAELDLDDQGDMIEASELVDAAVSFLQEVVEQVARAGGDAPGGPQAGWSEASGGGSTTTTSDGGSGWSAPDTSSGGQDTSGGWPDTSSGGGDTSSGGGGPGNHD